MNPANFLQPVYCHGCQRVSRMPVPAYGSEVQCRYCGASHTPTNGEDVFISYSSRDEDLARAIGAQLHEQDVTFWLAPEFIAIGEDFPERIAPAIKKCRVFVVLLTVHSVDSTWVNLELTYANNLKKTIIPVIIDDTELPDHLQFQVTRAQYVLTNQSTTEDAFKSLAHKIVQKLAIGELKNDATPPAEPIERVKIKPSGIDPTRPIFPGPQPYGYEMRRYYFGRVNEINMLTARIAEQRLTCIVSPSGAGKSSLLAAGLEPAFRQQGWDVISGARVGHPLDGQLRISPEAISNVFVFSAMRGIAESLFGAARVDAGETRDWTIAHYLRARPERPVEQKRLLIIDQFEELFTIHKVFHAHRRDFLTQIQDAMREDPDLRVVLAMRQEYIIDLKHVTQHLEEWCQPNTFELRRLDNVGATRVIKEIASQQAAFEGGVAERIVADLNMMRHTLEDGTPIVRPGEYIELVHLQIVCMQLWKHLQPGKKSISLDDLDSAARMMGQTFENFVRGALHSFYAVTIADVARTASPEVNEQGMAGRTHGYPESLLKLWCRLFVTAEQTRRQIPEGKFYTGRLPNWVMRRLVDKYLFRTSTVGSRLYYELSHDLLAPVVAAEIDPRTEQLLQASEMLETHLGAVLASRGATLKGWFENQDDQLMQCEPFLDAPGALQETELEFLMRASLATGTQLERWGRRVREEVRDRYNHILDEALANECEEVRGHAIRLLASDTSEKRRDELLHLLINDPSFLVRDTAAECLLDINEPDLFKTLLGVVRDQNTAQVRKAVAIVLMRSDALKESWFFAAYDMLDRRLRGRVRRIAWAMRFRKSAVIYPYIMIVAAAFSGIIAGAFKWIPGSFNWALVQASAGAFMATFHGVIAGTIWGGSIAVGVAMHRLVFYRARMKTSMFQPLGALVCGAMAGTISSLLVVAVIIYTYTIPSLETMGWIGHGEPNNYETPERVSLEFYTDLFVTTRMGWAHIIMGTTLGIAIAAITNTLRAGKKWDHFLEQQSDNQSVGQLLRSSFTISCVVAPHLWITVVTQTIAGFLVLSISRPGPGADGLNTEPLWGIVGDGSTQVLGSLGTCVGLGVIIIVIRRGLTIQPMGTT